MATGVVCPRSSGCLSLSHSTFLVVVCSGSGTRDACYATHHPTQPYGCVTLSLLPQLWPSEQADTNYILRQTYISNVYSLDPKLYLYCVSFAVAAESCLIPVPRHRRPWGATGLTHDECNQATEVCEINHFMREVLWGLIYADPVRCL